MKYFTRSDVAEMLAPTGEPAHPNTVIRWIKNGLVVGDRRVRLPATQLAFRVVHSEDNVRAFLRDLSAAYAAAGKSTQVISFEEAVARLPERSPRDARQPVNSVSMTSATV